MSYKRTPVVLFDNIVITCFLTFYNILWHVITCYGPSIYVLFFCHLTLITRIILWYITIVFPMVNINQRFTRNAQAPRDPGTRGTFRRWNCKTKRQVASPKPPGARVCAVNGSRRRFGKAMEKAMGDGWKMWKHCEKCGKNVENIGMSSI